MKAQFRIATETDITNILDFMRDYFALEGIGYDRERSGRALREFIGDDKRGSLWMVELSGEPAGYFCLAYSYTLQYYGKDCFIDELYIAPEFRNKGIGTGVMRFIEQHLTANRFKAMHLVVFDHNTAAYRFYIRNGFSAHSASFMTKEFTDAGTNSG